MKRAYEEMGAADLIDVSPGSGSGYQVPES
jgi:hypothetical protein